MTLLLFIVSKKILYGIVKKYYKEHYPLYETDPQAVMGFCLQKSYSNNIDYKLLYWMK